MDRAEKVAFVAASLMLLAFLSGVVYAVVHYDIGLPTCITSLEPFDSGEVIEHGADRLEIHYLATMWEFEPEEVEVPAGATLDLYLTSDDVIHGFQILGTDVNLMAVPGTVNYARVRLDRPGEYRIVCHEYCGEDHQAMAATLTVVEP